MPIRQNYAATLQMCFSNLVNATYKAETNDASTFCKWRRTLLPLLASMPRAPLEATLGGSLPRKIASIDLEFSPYYQEPDGLAEPRDVDSLVTTYNEKFCPVIYMRWLVNGNGGPSIPRQFKIIITELHRYISRHPASFAQVLRIDEAVDRKSSIGDVKQGHHVFINGKKSRVQNVGFAASYTWLCLDRSRECQMVDPNHTYTAGWLTCEYVDSSSS
jgi:hypothetical protein